MVTGLSAFDLLMQNIPAMVWILSGILPAGLSFLGGLPKIGKSWLALQIALYVATGANLWGRQVEQGPVLYLALEDGLSRMQARMKLQGWPADPNLPAHFVLLDDFKKTYGAFHHGGAIRLGELIEAEGYRLVVIDTFSRAFMGLKDIDANTEVTRALEPLQTTAQKQNASILIVDHHNKGSAGRNPDPINDILGSIAKGSVLDTAWGLYRERGKAGAKLHITGREVENQILSLEFNRTSMSWDCQSPINNAPFQLNNLQKDILRFLIDFGASTNAEISKKGGFDRSNCYKALKDMCNWGAASYDPNTGKYYVP